MVREVRPETLAPGGPGLSKADPRKGPRQGGGRWAPGQDTGRGPMGKPMPQSGREGSGHRWHGVLLRAVGRGCLLQPGSQGVLGGRGLSRTCFWEAKGPMPRPLRGPGALHADSPHRVPPEPPSVPRGWCWPQVPLPTATSLSPHLPGAEGSAEKGPVLNHPRQLLGSQASTLRRTGSAVSFAPFFLELSIFSGRQNGRCRHSAHL